MQQLYQKSQRVYGNLMKVYSGHTPEWCAVNRAKELATDLSSADLILNEVKISSLEAIALATIIDTLRDACKLKDSSEFIKKISQQSL